MVQFKLQVANFELENSRSAEFVIRRLWVE